MTKKQERAKFNLTMSILRQKKRFDTFIAFTGEAENKVKQAYNYFKGCESTGIIPGCDCGCGGDNLNEDMYNLGADVYCSLNY